MSSLEVYHNRTDDQRETDNENIHIGILESRSRMSENEVVRLQCKELCTPDIATSRNKKIERSCRSCASVISKGGAFHYDRRTDFCAGKAVGEMNIIC